MNANFNSNQRGQFEDKPVASDMDNSFLQELFLSELKDLYWAEKYLVKNLPQVAEAATSEELKRVIETHFAETTKHVLRLEQVFASIGHKPEIKRCESMQGLVEEINRMITETEEGSMVRDVAIISSAQKIEHYEIATYGTLRTLSNVLGHLEAETLLSETLEEEKNVDITLTTIAQEFINESAKRERR
jgi:ferritin-like metal-binding protein YciE